MLEKLVPILAVIVGFVLGFIAHIWKDNRERKYQYETDVYNDIEILRLFFKERISNLKYPEFENSWIHDELCHHFPKAWLRLSSASHGIVGNRFINSRLKFFVQNLIWDLELKKPLRSAANEFAPITDDDWLAFYDHAVARLSEANHEISKFLK